MPKLKTVKGIAERFKVTGTGQLIGRRSGRRHLLGGKRAKIKRHLRRPRLLAEVDARKLRSLLPYQ